MERIKGRTAFVTGAASGIGLAIAESLLDAGARVVLADRDDAALERECARLGSSALEQHLDVTDRAGWMDAKRATEAAFGPVEILVNNAGVAPDWSDLADMPVEHFDRLVAIMLTGVFNGVWAFGGRLRELGEGHIVNMASMVGLIGLPRQGAYVAAKAGVVGLSETLRAEMAPYGIGVSVVCPARVRSNLLSGSVPADRAADDGMDPRLVASRIIDAIRDDELYVITHAEHRSYVADRSARLLAAFDRARHAEQAEASSAI